jgi:hypothetical protein
MVQLNAKLQITILTLILVLFMNGNPTFAKTWKPGVSCGDYFYYEMYGAYSSSHTNATLKIPQFEQNITDWTKINITAIDGSIVYQQYTLHFRNGSEISFSFKSDVNPENMSSLKFTDKGVPLCAANLNPGDTIPTDDIAIHETVRRNYTSCTRETNHASWNSSNDWGDLYFDRQTGVLVELRRTHQFSSNVTNEIVWKTDLIRLVISSEWEINSQPSPINSMFMALIAILFSLIAFVTVTICLVARKTCKRLIAKKTPNYR